MPDIRTPNEPSGRRPPGLSMPEPKTGVPGQNRPAKRVPGRGPRGPANPRRKPR